LKIPAGLWYLLDPASGKNKNKEKDYPKELPRLELRGMASGPIQYLRSRRHLRQVRDRLPVVVPAPDGT